jgi:undecaprenyl-diphosphatase
MIDYLEMLDRSLLLFFNGLNCPALDKIMWFISGKYEWIPLYLFILFLFFKKGKWHGFIFFAATILTIALADLSSVHIFKEGFQRYRPSHNLDIQHLIHFVDNYRGGKFGFVSSHAANTFALATISSLILNKKWFSWTIFSWAALVAVSRMYLGVHYPTDISVGAMLGVGIGYLVYFLLRLTKLSKNAMN